MTADQTHRAELMLTLEAGEGAVDRLEAVLAAVPVASLVVTPLPGRELGAGEALPLVAAAQKRGIATLLADDARLARTVKADGVHLRFSDDCRGSFETARSVVGGRAIIGADAGRSRDDAMTIGELGADYVAFGIPSFVKERETAFERQLDLIAWWAEIFEIPCVAMDAEDAGQAAALAAAGADFVSLALPAGLAVADAVDRARAWSVAIGGAGEDQIE